MKAKYRKDTCDKCNLDGDCDCQKSQEKCNNCGMEQVLGYNKHYNKALKNGTLEFNDTFENGDYIE